MTFGRRDDPAVAHVFIDVEASALVGGYPIEIGWAVANADGTVSCDAILINPGSTSWTESCHWDLQSERLHGITRAELKEGFSPYDTAEIVNAGIGRENVYSDSPTADGAWVDMLFREAHQQAGFTIVRKPAGTLIVELAGAVGTGDLDYTAAEREARRRAGRRHRAGPDAAYWAHLWMLLSCGYRAPAGTRPGFGPLRLKP